jgi:hypothetical protein
MGNLRVHVLYKDFYYRTQRNSILMDAKELKPQKVVVAKNSRMGHSVMT